MKKFIYVVLVALLLIPNIVLADENMIENANSEVNLIASARSGLLMEASTGEIIFEKNIHDKVAVASMTKMVAQILILEAIENGSLSWDEKITVSANAAGMGGSQIWLQTGEVISVRDLMKGISMASANDATVALAERLAGTEEAFVKKMNEKIKELGLKNTNFVNSTGLDEENHYSSAYDMGIIAKELLKHEQILEFSGTYEDYIREDSTNKYWVVNTNKLVRFYEGADGLKTGHTDAALYCMAVTAKKNNMRLIAVVLGVDNAQTRNNETTQLLDYGFNLYEMTLLKNKNDEVGDIVIEKAENQNQKILTNSDIGILHKKGEEVSGYSLDLKLNEIKLPLKKGTIIGKVLLKNKNDEVIGSYDAIVNEDINKTKFFTLYKRVLEEFLTMN